jgi:NADPH:quinone reductase-like Zn-dependent oxidoreductase
MPHAIRIHAHGGPEVLRWEAIAASVPGRGEVLIRQTAIGLNFIDIYERTGLYPGALPSGLGREGAGVVEAVMLALGVPVEFVAPVVWKRAMGLGTDKTDARAKASLTFPKHAGLWPKKLHHNRAEAALLAHYGWQRKA